MLPGLDDASMSAREIKKSKERKTESGPHYPWPKVCHRMNWCSSVRKEAEMLFPKEDNDIYVSGNTSKARNWINHFGWTILHIL